MFHLMDRPPDTPTNPHLYTQQAQGREGEAEAAIQLKKAEQATLHKEVGGWVRG
jgi:hypothetical protein